jgi:glycosyltransferase involved in cell wall biosynthesis
MRVSIIIPCYNEQRTIRAVLERVAHLRIDGASTEIIVVNDGSQDNTRTLLDEFVFPPGVLGRIHHGPTNLGKGAGMRIGMALATGDVIAFQDADLELDPAELPKLIRPILEHQADVVYGSRFLGPRNRGVPRSSRLANWLLSAATNLLYCGSLTDMETAYKVFSRRVSEQLRLRCVRFDIEPEITAKILRLGFRIVELPISYSPRSVSMGKKIGWMDGVEALWTLFRLRFTPLPACRRTPVSLAPQPEMDFGTAAQAFG